MYGKRNSQIKKQLVIPKTSILAIPNNPGTAHSRKGASASNARANFNICRIGISEIGGFHPISPQGINGESLPAERWLVLCNVEASNMYSTPYVLVIKFLSFALYVSPLLGFNHIKK
eukprot:TRINITY_DN23289_c1_g2_i4.p1 TRINITY_DN23289_c1_g2~~TRINITY_DN23289_c1_g2_i4.p1  ORF type:complete len:117 (-),score=12.83 TRINITY_DN23289_c1_g2_i4:7-357(-)